jgi:deoxyribonuclease-4
MPLFGAHLSIAGGFHKAIDAAAALGMETVQIFTHSPSQWAVKPAIVTGKEGFQSANPWQGKALGDEEVQTFRRALRQSRLRFPLAHDSYLINLASPDDLLYRKSLEAFVAEIQRAEQLGLAYLVTHPGAHMGSGEEAGLRRVALALDEAHARCPRFRVKILLETTAGQGTSLGWRFEHLAEILKQVADSRRLGVCLDTCHVFAAGYALAPRAEYEATLQAFDRLVGLTQLKAFHVNDSLKPLGSRVDRHAHIGRGHLGAEPFRLLVNDPRFRGRPMVLETAKEEGDEPDMDTVNLTVLRGLVDAGNGEAPQAAGGRSR